MGTEHQEKILNQASEKFWEQLQAYMEDVSEDVTEEHLSEYLDQMIPQEVIDLSKIYDTYLKDGVIDRIEEAQREFAKALCLRTLLKGLSYFGYNTRLTTKT